MPRGSATDTLPADVADRVRLAVTEARRIKGLRNADLARRLRWDSRAVTSCLQANRSLRLPKAKALIGAVHNLHPRRHGKRLPAHEAGEVARKAHRVLAPASAAITNLDPDVSAPAVLIAASELEALAGWIARRLSLSDRQRGKMEKRLLSILASSAPRFASVAAARMRGYRTSPISEDTALAVLASFGYRSYEKPRASR
jgi:hypothetical protein